jgi:hypothetical protein
MMQITDNLTMTLQFSMGLILVKFEEKKPQKKPTFMFRKEIKFVFHEKKNGLGG